MHNIYKVNYKISSKKNCDYIHLSDFHGYFDMKLAEEIKNTDTEFVVISGDILNGYQWTNLKKLDQINKFLSIISEKHPIIVGLGNHDLFGLSKKGFKNFKELGNIKNVYPIYNESIILKGHRFTNFLPTLGTFNYLRQGSKKTVNRLLKCMDKLEPVSENSEYIEHLVSHNPYHFCDDKLIDKVSKYDFIETGHFHDGWVPTKVIDKSYDKYFDKGLQELLRKKISFKKGNGLVVKPRRNLSRGILYILSDGYVVLLPNDSIYFYNYISNEYFKKDVNYLNERLDNNKVPALIISGAINTIGRIKNFYPYVTHIAGTKEPYIYDAYREVKDLDSKLNDEDNIWIK